ncbi:IS3 family transposase [Paenibacillus sp. GSMTC-2017]|uniref:IS3 family transposase n=1 Tax=Paenibacillus sp. GSMTC-2017 TaxID=2794350 RepID=UPI003FA6E01B
MYVTINSVFVLCLPRYATTDSCPNQPVYNEERIKKKLKKLTPVEYRRQLVINGFIRCLLN